MKIAVLGCGAIGSLYAAHLAQNGSDDVLCIVKSQQHASQINESGIKIINTDGSIYLSAEPRAVTDTGSESPADIVLISVKSYATKDAVREHSGIFGPDTIALTLQNGYGNHKALLSVVYPEKTVMGTTAMGVNIDSGGRIILAGQGDTVIGSLSPGTGGGNDSLTTVMKVLSSSGFDVKKTDDAEDAVLRKLLINIGINALCTINDRENRCICEDEKIRSVSEKLVYEAADILNRVFGRDYDAGKVWSDVISVAEKTGSNICSMLQDARKKRPTEIGAINGAIVDIADSAGLDAPENRKITEEILRLSEY